MAIKDITPELLADAFVGMSDKRPTALAAF